MSKTSVAVIGFLLLSITVLWSGVDAVRHGDPEPLADCSDSFIVPSSTVPGEHQDRYALTVLSGAVAPSACLNGENNKGRCSKSCFGRLMPIVRPLGGPASIARGVFLIFGDIRSLYGLVRPYLFLCRFQN